VSVRVWAWAFGHSVAEVTGCCGVRARAWARRTDVLGFGGLILWAWPCGLDLMGTGAFVRGDALYERSVLVDGAFPCLGSWERGSGRGGARLT
jgi:hypothetical protein